MKILLATKNLGKIKEFKAILSLYNIELISLDNLNDNSEVIENGNTFKENAFKKANYYYNKYNIPTLADDSGLIVDSLNGQPGVNSARFSGEHATDKANNKKLLSLLKDEHNRFAYFKCVLCFVIGPDKVFYFKGKLEGKIGEAEIGDKGFGYDPIFIPSGYQISLGKLTENEKNRISHRFQAIKKFEKFLEKSEYNV